MSSIDHPHVPLPCFPCGPSSKAVCPFKGPILQVLHLSVVVGGRNTSTVAIVATEESIGNGSGSLIA
jgi:hypothetical protein